MSYKKIPDGFVVSFSPQQCCQLQKGYNCDELHLRYYSHIILDQAFTGTAQPVIKRALKKNTSKNSLINFQLPLL